MDFNPYKFAAIVKQKSGDGKRKSYEFWEETTSSSGRKTRSKMHKEGGKIESGNEMGRLLIH